MIHERAPCRCPLAAPPPPAPGVWTFDDDGRVTRFRHYSDTAKHIAATRGEDTTVR